MTITIGLESEKMMQNEEFKWTCDRTYWVQHAALDASHTILLDPALPQPYNFHPENPILLVRSTTIERDTGQGRLKSKVNVHYETLVPREKSEQAENPLARPARITWATENERVPIVLDKDDEPILNKAGDLLLGIEEDRALWRITVTKNVASVPAWVATYQNAINSDQVIIGGLAIAAKKLKLDSIQIGESMVENNVQFYQITFSFLFRQEGWEVKVLNTGLREIVKVQDFENNTEYDELQPILDSNGEPVQEEVFLDNEGKAIRENQGNDSAIQPIKTNLTQQEMITLTFETKDELPFSALPLT